MSEKKEGINEKSEPNENQERFADDPIPWIDSLDELSEIEKAFGIDELCEKKLCGKTILDIGTYGIKPLYIALKYKPKKIIGINDEFDDSFRLIEPKSKLFVKTEIKFYNCSFFNNVKLTEILDRENQKLSDFVLISKTLHHLRSGTCIAERREPGHCCKEDEKCCIYEFNEKEIFERLLCLGKRVIVYEAFNPETLDADKVRGRGGHFTTNEWKQIFGFLERSENYRVELIQPIGLHLDRDGIREMSAILRQVDALCFYVERVEEKQ